MLNCDAFLKEKGPCGINLQSYGRRTWPCLSRASDYPVHRQAFLSAKRLHQPRVLPAPTAAGGTLDAQQAGALGRSDAPPAGGAASLESAQRLQPPTIAVLSYREWPDVARTAVENIAAAFKDDPSTTYFCRPDQRVQFYRSVLTCLLDCYPEERQLVCTLPPDAAAVVYVYPRVRELGSWTKLLRGGLAPLACVQLGRLVAGMDASDFFEGQRGDFLNSHGPFMYVSVMAVRRDRQGRGLGSALLAFMCDRADASGLHCYIEATSARNRALYERFGFELIKGWRANPEMPYTYVLSRPPRPLEGQPTITAMVEAKNTAPAPAAAVVPWWQQGEQRRQRFAEWRQRQRQRQQWLNQQQPQRVIPQSYDNILYAEWDADSWWPLSPGEMCLSAKNNVEARAGAPEAASSEGNASLNSGARADATQPSAQEVG